MALMNCRDQGETQICFLYPTIATKGESCEIMKLSIFGEELQLPSFTDNLHNCDPNYAEKFGLKDFSQAAFGEFIFRQTLSHLLGRKLMWMSERTRLSKVKLNSKASW
uniref:Uncharacterized protein n=1 Tax=Romanomermis culicivorax TaxID=13658 RepID=A0A915HGC5_ROMCU